MGFLDNLFRRPKPSDDVQAPEHAVLVHLKLSDAALGTAPEREAIHDLEHRLEAAIATARVGELDGDEFGEGECTLFMYGPDADSLFAAIEQELRISPLSAGGWVIKRYGPASDPASAEVRLEL